MEELLSTYFQTKDKQIDKQHSSKTAVAYQIDALLELLSEIMVLINGFKSNKIRHRKTTLFQSA